MEKLRKEPDMEENDLKIELNKLKGINTRMKNYLDIFNEEFDTKVKLRDAQIPLITQMAKEFLDKNYSITDINSYLIDKKSEIEDKLIPTFIEEQKKLFEIWEYITNEMMLDMQEQGFIYGFIARTTNKRRSKENSLIN